VKILRLAAIMAHAATKERNRNCDAFAAVLRFNTDFSRVLWARSGSDEHRTPPLLAPLHSQTERRTGKDGKFQKPIYRPCQSYRIHGGPPQARGLQFTLGRLTTRSQTPKWHFSPACRFNEVGNSMRTSKHFRTWLFQTPKVRVLEM